MSIELLLLLIVYLYNIIKIPKNICITEQIKNINIIVVVTFSLIDLFLLGSVYNITNKILTIIPTMFNITEIHDKISDFV